MRAMPDLRKSAARLMIIDVHFNAALRAYMPSMMTVAVAYDFCRFNDIMQCKSAFMYLRQSGMLYIFSGCSQSFLAVGGVISLTPMF